MKIKLILLNFLFLTLMLNGFAQLKVNSGGRVGVGGLDPDATYKLSLNSAIFVSGYTYPNLIIAGDPTNQPYGRAIYPSSNNTCKLGLSNLAFNGIWTYSLTNLSDGRQKENIKDITDALGIIMKLKGIKYDLKKEYSYLPEELNGTSDLTELDALRKNKVGFLQPENDVSIASDDVTNILYGDVISEQTVTIQNVTIPNGTVLNVRSDETTISSNFTLELGAELVIKNEAVHDCN